MTILEWHPTAENILLSAGFDHKIFIWNVAKGKDLFRNGLNTLLISLFEKICIGWTPLGPSVQSKLDFSDGNLNQGPISVSELEPNFFFRNRNFVQFFKFSHVFLLLRGF